MSELTQQELLQIYEAAQSTDPDTLKQTAARLFPQRWGQEEPVIYLLPGGSRGFAHNGRITPPKFTIGTPPLRQIGVMEDGTAYPY